MAMLGMALLVLALRRDSVRWCGLAGLVWGLAFFVPHVAWANESAGTMPWLALAALQAALVAAGAAVWSVTRRARWLSARRPLVPVVFASTWTATEQVRSTWPFGGFPWGRLAFSQVDGPLLRLAWFGGAPLVSAFVAGSGFVLAAAWLAAQTGTRRRTLPAAAGIAAVTLLSGALPVDVDAQSGTLRLAAVQGNVSASGTADAVQNVLDNEVAGTLALRYAVGGDRLDLVLWPESSTDIDPRTDPSTAIAVDRAARALGAPILVGTNRYTEAGRYNELILWQPGRGPTFAYAKQRPVPFGEYVPLRGLMRRFAPEVDRVRVDVLRGVTTAIVPLSSPRLGRQVSVGAVICFEVAFDDVVRDAVRNGAEMLVIATNNASFGRTPESTQQLAMSRLRAVEHGRAAVQVSTVGVSAVIAPDGTVEQRTDLFTADALVAELPLRTSLTPADRLGDGPTAAALAVALAGAAAGIAGAPGRRARARTSRIDAIGGRLDSRGARERGRRA